FKRKRSWDKPGGFLGRKGGQRELPRQGIRKARCPLFVPALLVIVVRSIGAYHWVALRGWAAIGAGARARPPRPGWFRRQEGLTRRPDLPLDRHLSPREPATSPSP